MTKHEQQHILEKLKKAEEAMRLLFEEYKMVAKEFDSEGKLGEGLLWHKRAWVMQDCYLEVVEDIQRIEGRA